MQQHPIGEKEGEMSERTPEELFQAEHAAFMAALDDEEYKYCDSSDRRDSARYRARRALYDLGKADAAEAHRTCHELAEALGKRVQEAESARDYYKSMLDELHGYVAQMCERFGDKLDEVPCDAWRLRDHIIAMQTAREQDRATLARVEALPERWAGEAAYANSVAFDKGTRDLDCVYWQGSANAYGKASAELRAALAPQADAERETG